jgi:DNA-binding NarL/FixJ family response regulator
MGRPPLSLAITAINVLIIGDDPLARAGVAILLADRAGYTIVGQIADDADLTSITSYHADVAVWDLGAEPRLSLEFTGDLRDAGLPVIALIPDESSAAGPLNAGVQGILFRTVDGSSLLAALSAVQLGFLVLDPALAIARPRVPNREGFPLAEELTAREFEVLQLMAEGISNKALAERLAISEHTAKFHVTAILGKLNAQTRTEAVARAARLGLILL